MYCKYCGKKLDGNMEVCPECEEKIANGENPFFSVPTYRDPVKELKNDVALREQKADLASSNQTGENATETTATHINEPAANPNTANPTTENPTTTNPANPAPAYRSGEAESRYSAARFSDKYNGARNGGYTRTSGLVFGILSVALPWAGLVTSLIAISMFAVFFRTPVMEIGMLVLTFIAGIIVSLVFGIKAIVEFKRAKRSGVSPVATLVLGIVGLAQIAELLLSVMYVSPLSAIL